MNTAALEQVSVVIPTHNRRTALLQCLDALARQDYPAARLEVLVVADGCTDDTIAALSGYSFPAALRILQQPGAGAAAARNRGAGAARGDLLLFLDDDVIASVGLVNAHVEAHAVDRPRVVVGPYLLDPPREPDYLSEALGRFWGKAFARLADADREPSYTDLLSGNLSVPAHLFDRLGGFDPAFPECGIEDYELGVRVVRAEIPIVFAPDARARHLDTTDLRRSLARNRRGGSSLVLLARRHPSIVHKSPLVRPGSLVQKLAFEHPVLGGWYARLAFRVLSLAQALRLKRLWYGVYGRLRLYWFWLGVHDQAGTLMEWRRELDCLRATADGRTQSRP